MTSYLKSLSFFFFAPCRKPPCPVLRLHTNKTSFNSHQQHIYSQNSTTCIPVKMSFLSMSRSAVKTEYWHFYFRWFCLTTKLTQSWPWHTLAAPPAGGAGPPPSITCWLASCFWSSWWSDGACQPYATALISKLINENYHQFLNY